MSQIVHTDELVTKNELKEFYDRIYPYLNGVIGVGGGFAPIGAVEFFDAITAPQDWLVCDGTVYNIVDYPQLAQHYAVNHGAANFYGGDGVTTFAVPDWQGEFFRASGTNAHTNQGNGSAVGVHQDGTQHVNIGVANTSKAFFIESLSGDSGQTYVVNPDTRPAIGSTVQTYINMSTSGSAANKRTWYTSRPTNTSLLCCVKAIDAGEVYSTSERKVGTWLDGKPIYQRTIEIPANKIPNNNSTVFSNVFSNADTIVDFKGMLRTKSSISSYTWTPLPRIQPNSYDKNMGVDIDTANNAIYLKGTGFNYTAVFDLGYMTIQYTKTTD